ncbi:hypothetical protein OG979_34615 [Actinomadura citrea]|uniref:hypothetical protein n=1 Tax=Actinomadura citrea TaxID=46158 RepID=UPI002E2C26F1|nr:hypothetical protein [Actinomadura citrea]
MTEYSQTAVIVVADMAGSASRNDMGKRHARKEMYAWLERTLGPEWSRCAREDRGDGVLMLWPLSVPDPVPPKIIVSRFLRLPETAPAGPERPRLRVAVHIGQTFRDDHGFAGASIDETFRLNEAGTLKASLAEARGPVAYLLSEDVHKAVVRYGYEDFDPSSFHPTVVKVKESTLEAWLHLPAEDELAARLAAQGTATADNPAGEPGQTNGVHLSIGGNAQISGTSISGRDLYL